MCRAAALVPGRTLVGAFHASFNMPRCYDARSSQNSIRKAAQRDQLKSSASILYDSSPRICDLSFSSATTAQSTPEYACSTPMRRGREPDGRRLHQVRRDLFDGHVSAIGEESQDAQPAPAAEPPAVPEGNLSNLSSESNLGGGLSEGNLSLGSGDGDAAPNVRSDSGISDNFGLLMEPDEEPASDPGTTHPAVVIDEIDDVDRREQEGQLKSTAEVWDEVSTEYGKLRALHHVSHAAAHAFFELFKKVRT